MMKPEEGNYFFLDWFADRMASDVANFTDLSHSHKLFLLIDIKTCQEPVS